jgi:hypothetical protein
MDAEASTPAALAEGWISNAPLNKAQPWERRALNRLWARFAAAGCALVWGCLALLYYTPPYIDDGKFFYNGFVLTFALVVGMAIVYACGHWGNSQRVDAVLFEQNGMKLKLTSSKTQEIAYTDVRSIGRFNLFGDGGFSSFDDPENKSYAIRYKLRSLNDRPTLPVNAQIAGRLIDAMRERKLLP